MLDFAAAAAANRNQSRAFVGVLVGVAGSLGAAFDTLFGTAPTVTLATLAGTALASWIAERAGDGIVLGTLGARPTDPADPAQRQLENLVREVAVAAGLPAPRTYVISDPAPNALATGRTPETAAIAVTSGLLEVLDRAETQGVVAHEMAHVGNRDTRLGVLVAVLLGAIALLSDLAWRLAGGREDRSPGLVLLLLGALTASAPLVSRLLALAISRQREYLADATAVELTRNPLALAAALERIASDPRPTRAGVRGTAHLFFASPRARRADERTGFLADLWATHPPIHERIARLRAMAGDAGA